jgi:hypothetical protein
MTTKSFLRVSILFLVLIVAKGVSGQDNHVGYNFNSFPSYMSIQYADGTWGPPEQRVVFGKEMQARHALSAKVGEKIINCPLAYQDVGYLFDKEGKKHAFQILAYTGCPFEIDTLTVDKDIVLREKTTLRIDSTQGTVLQLTNDSSLPFAANQEGPVYRCVTCVNMEWSFLKAGMTFDTKDAIYSTTKSNASIAFTKDGIKMDGINKKEKSPQKQ